MAFPIKVDRDGARLIFEPRERADMVNAALLFLCN
jgi:hypothetical protein